KSLVLIVEDPDSPKKVWTHWLVWNIPPSGKIKEKSIPGIEGKNDFEKQHYGGPCPPWGIHHYHFKVYALDDLLELKKDARKEEVEKAMSTHVIAFGELIGLYKRTL
ncbi:MAG: YbhB/YbcL family Raf kinase inhibitor-like protein, partial [Bacteroidia bacterium]